VVLGDMRYPDMHVELLISRFGAELTRLLSNFAFRHALCVSYSVSACFKVLAAFFRSSHNSRSKYI